jgi:hypothetical protein
MERADTPADEFRQADVAFHFGAGDGRRESSLAARHAGGDPNERVLERVLVFVDLRPRVARSTETAVPASETSTRCPGAATATNE